MAMMVEIFYDFEKVLMGELDKLEGNCD